MMVTGIYSPTLVKELRHPDLFLKFLASYSSWDCQAIVCGMGWQPTAAIHTCPNDRGRIIP
jgi:rubrerythrin